MLGWVLARTRANHGGGRRPGGWCRQQSSPTPRVDPVTQRFPSPFFDPAGETFAVDAQVGPLVGRLLLSPRQGGPQPFLDQSAQRRPFALGDLPRAHEQILGDLDRRLHMGPISWIWVPRKASAPCRKLGGVW